MRWGSAQNKPDVFRLAGIAADRKTGSYRRPSCTPGRSGRRRKVSASRHARCKRRDSDCSGIALGSEASRLRGRLACCLRSTLHRPSIASGCALSTSVPLGESSFGASCLGPNDGSGSPSGSAASLWLFEDSGHVAGSRLCALERNRPVSISRAPRPRRAGVSRQPARLGG